MGGDYWWLAFNTVHASTKNREDSLKMMVGSAESATVASHPCSSFCSFFFSCTLLGHCLSFNFSSQICKNNGSSKMWMKRTWQFLIWESCTFRLVTGFIFNRRDPLTHTPRLAFYESMMATTWVVPILEVLWGKKCCGVQILDKAIRISHSTGNYGKVICPPIFPFTYWQIVG